MTLAPIETIKAAVDGGARGIVNSGGGQIVITLLRNGVEVSGNGYTRGVTSLVSPAVGLPDGLTAQARATSVTMTATGGGIEFDQFEIRSADGSVVLFKSPKSAAVTIEPGGPRTVTLVFNSASTVRRTAMNVRDLGCVPMHEDGTSNDVAAANSAFVNEYLNSGWRYSDFLPLYYPGCGWLHGATISIPAITGYAITGANGEQVQYSEIQYTEESLWGGICSRIVGNSVLAASGDPIIKIAGHGICIDGVSIQGDWSPVAGLYDKYPLPSSDDNRCNIGIEILGSEEYKSSGKMVCPAHLTIAMCKTGMLWGHQTSQNHADQNLLNRYYAPGCDVGIEIDNRQCLGAHIEYFDQGKCSKGILLKAGGKFRIGTLSMEGDSKVGIEITGNDGTPAENLCLGYCDVDRLTLDNSAPNDAVAYRILPTTGYLAMNSTIGHLFSTLGQAGRENNPLIEITNSYGDLTIEKASNLYEGCITYTGGTTEFFHTQILQKAVFLPDNSPENAITKTGTYKLQRHHSLCREQHGYGDTIEGGVFFDPVTVVEQSA